MVIRQEQHGFTLVELLVVLAIVLVLIIILFPINTYMHERKSRDICINNIRQLNIAVQMYAQDNKRKYPDKEWNTAIESYLTSQKTCYCPKDDVSGDRMSPITYGNNALLVLANGTGVNESQVIMPDEVGTLCDAHPVYQWSQGGGLIGGGGFYPSLNAYDDGDSNADDHVVYPEARHNGIVVGYCDGHVKFFPGKHPNTKEINDRVSRAFYQPLGLGFITNYGGGLMKISVKAGKHPVLLGGDPAGMPLVLAAAEAWRANGGRWKNLGFTGANSAAKKAAMRGQYCWVSTNSSGFHTNEVPIACDALVMIVSRNSKLKAVTRAHPRYALTAKQIARLFSANQGTVPAGSKDARQAYTYPITNGSRSYMETRVMEGGKIGSKAIVVKDDWEMVSKVAADPYGIGYCSAAAADPQRVRVLDIITSDGAGKHYPNSDRKHPDLMPDTTYGTQYPYLRVISVQYARKGEAAQFVKIFKDLNYQTGPLFMASYFTP